MDSVISETYAYTLNAKVFRPGKSKDEVLKGYDEMSAKGTYDGIVGNPKFFKGPQMTADVAEKYYNEMKSVSVLDVGAGSGLVGELMSLKGFTNMHALDPSQGMLKLAREKTVYQQLFCSTLEDNTIIEKYDCIVCCGAMGPGHIPKEGLQQMVTLTKPGGRVIIVMREEYLQTSYHGQLEVLMADMEHKGIWSKEERTIYPDYAYGTSGCIFVYIVM